MAIAQQLYEGVEIDVFKTRFDMNDREFNKCLDILKEKYPDPMCALHYEKDYELMKRFIKIVLPFTVLPILIPIYRILDSSVFVNVFGCGCVPYSQTNMLNIPFNANDLRGAVFGIIAVVMSVMGVKASRQIKFKLLSWLYIVIVIGFNSVLAIWVTKTFMWA